MVSYTAVEQTKTSSNKYINKRHKFVAFMRMKIQHSCATYRFVVIIKQQEMGMVLKMPLNFKICTYKFLRSMSLFISFFISILSKSKEKNQKII